MRVVNFEKIKVAIARIIIVYRIQICICQSEFFNGFIYPIALSSIFPG